MLGATIRTSGIPLNPWSEATLKAIDGCQLHPNLVNLYITAKENFYSYIKIGVDPKPVFITYDNEKLYNDVSNWNISKLKSTLM